MKKKALSLLLAGCIVVGSLVGCGGGGQQTAADSSGTTQAAAPADDTSDAGGEKEEAAPVVDEANLTEVQKIIKEAEGMSMEELAKKAIE